MNVGIDEELKHQNDDEVMKLLWQDRKHCVVRATCGVADALGVAISPALVRHLLQIDNSRQRSRYQILQRLGIHTYRFNIDHALADITNLIDEINRESHGSVPHPQIVNANSWEEALQLTLRGELAIFMDPFPGHDAEHVLHVGYNSGLVTNNDLECIQDRYEAFQVPLLNQAFQHKATHVALFPKK